MRLTNCTESPRGIMLSTGSFMLGPRETRSVPPALEEAMRRTLKLRIYQGLTDAGIFRVDEKMKVDEESAKQDTPAPPPELSNNVDVKGLLNPVGAEMAAQLGNPVKVVDEQSSTTAPAAVADVSAPAAARKGKKK